MCCLCGRNHLSNFTYASFSTLLSSSLINYIPQAGLSLARNIYSFSYFPVFIIPFHFHTLHSFPLHIFVPRARVRKRGTNKVPTYPSGFFYMHRSSHSRPLSFFPRRSRPFFPFRAEIPLGSRSFGPVQHQVNALVTNAPCSYVHNAYVCVIAHGRACV